MPYINQNKDKMYYQQLDMKVNIGPFSQVDLLCIEIIIKFKHTFITMKLMHIKLRSVSKINVK